MLTREVMGVFALGVLWLNTLLVVLAALARARGLLARRRALRPIDPNAAEGYGLVEGTLGASAQGAAAELAIEQVGRYAAGTKRAILWHDRSHASLVRPCTVTLGDSTVALEGAASPRAEVWLDAEAVVAAAERDRAGSFDAVYPAAKKARGSTRTVVVQVESGTKVWVAGEVRRAGGASTFGPGVEAPLLVATVDPRAWLARRATWLVLFAPVAFATCAACTAVALHAPVFDGWVSKVGGLLCFVYFLLILPAGTRMRDFTAIPSARALRGRWDAPAVGADAAAG